MSYKVVKKEEAQAYIAKGHYDMRGTHLHIPEDVGGSIALNHSHFLPGGYAEMGKAPVEMLYYILRGEMTVTLDDGAVFVLGPDDSIHFSQGQVREVRNNGCVTAEMLVIACAPSNK